MNSKEVYLKKNSRINYNGKILTGDDMYFNQITGFGTAKGNVTLRDPAENRYMKGGYGEIYEKKDSAMMTERPYAVKILEKDSMYFSAQRLLAYQKVDDNDPLKKKSFLRAFRKARMYKSNIQVRADSLSFNETDGIMHLFGAPIAWSGEKQVTGDKIEAYFDTENEFIDSLKVVGNAFAISKADSLNLKDEFNQVKGKLMTVYYKDNKVNLAKVIGNAQAITYADDQNEKTKEVERIGVALSTCGTIEAEFEDNTVQIISCNVGANSDIYPMSKISREKRFFPDFNWNTKDRLKRWEDIFLDSPGYEETVYESADTLYNEAQKAIDEAKAKEEAKKPKRVRK
jgi:lipopolysaccharide export system protein LptA